MAILTHGSDLSLAPTIRPIVKQLDGTVKSAVATLADAGFSAVQLDATLSGIRPRDLDIRARKDLLAVFTRRGLTLAGIDLFIPRKHFTEPENLDRAMSAALAGIGLAADLGRVPLSIALPVKAMSDDSKKTLVEAADGHSVRLAVHAEEQVDELLAWINAVDLHALGAALDPAAVLMRGRDPGELVGKFKRRLAVARLSDVSGTTSGDDEETEAAAGLRSAVGEGDLDVVGYRIALDLAGGRSGPVVLDLRGMENPLTAAARAKREWEKSAFTV